jgi:hypothetical protein
MIPLREEKFDDLWSKLQNHLDILNSNILLALFVSNVSHANDNFG